MTIERAIEILDPEHRENYDSLETVNEACRMGSHMEITDDDFCSYGVRKDGHEHG